MKKLLFLTTSLLLSIICLASQYEYVNDKYCVYQINVENQTATVINFISDASSVTIPASFVYKGDKYIVESIDCSEWFPDNYKWKYGYEDYKQHRASIVELFLPQTLKHISGGIYGVFSGGAFSDMTRLKKIIIPAGVENFTIGWFYNNSRLESIIFEGVPCYEYRIVNRYGTDGKNYRVCISEVDQPTAIVDSMTYALRDKYPRPCPKLQKIEVLPLKEFILYKNKLEKTYHVYSQQLRDTINMYTQLLMNNPYYVDENYFETITLNQPHLQVKGVKDNFALQVSALKKDYNKQLALCKEKYSISMSDMENICKRKNPELYAEKYCALHPDFSAQIDTLLKDYKCEYTKQRLALCILKNYQLGEKCQDKLWKKYAYLFENKEAFLSTYYKSSNIKNVISLRDETYHLFKYFIKESINGKKMKLKGAYDMEGSIGRDFCRNYDKMRDRGIPVSEEIINLDPKAQKEFIKNGQYFSNADDFFAAYIRLNYSNILKAKKKASK